MEKKIGELKKLKKEQLIIECKKLAIKINELKKEMLQEKNRWFKYYGNKNWREENKGK